MLNDKFEAKPSTTIPACATTMRVWEWSQSLQYLPFLVALAIVVMVLIPADVWNRPTNDAVYHGFDSNLIYYADTRGGTSHEGMIQVSPESIKLTALPFSEPTVHLLTSQLDYRVSMDLRVLMPENAAGDSRFQIKLWSPREQVAYSLNFGPPPNYLLTGQIVSKENVVKTKTVGTYIPDQSYHMEFSLDRKMGTIQFHLAPLTPVVGVNGSKRIPTGVPDPAVLKSSITADDVPALFYQLPVALTLSITSARGIASAVLENYVVSLPSQQWMAVRIDDDLATGIMVVLLVMGYLAVLGGYISWACRKAKQALAVGGSSQPSTQTDARAATRNRLITIAIAGAIGAYLALNCMLFGLGSHTFDMDGQKIWAYVAAHYSITDLYHLPATVPEARSFGGVPYAEAIFPYGPTMTYYFAMVGWVDRLFFPEPGPMHLYSFSLEFIIKSFNVLFGLIDGLLIYLILRGLKLERRASLLATALFLFNPALWFIMSIWGTSHTVSLFFVLASIWMAMRKSPFGAWLLLSGAGLTRPQLLAPAFLLALVYLRFFPFRQNLFAVSRSIIVTFLCLAPFALTLSPSLPVDNLLQNARLQNPNSPAVGNYYYVSYDGLSIWPLLTGFLGGESGKNRIYYPASTPLVGGIDYTTLSNLLFLIMFSILVARLLLQRKSLDWVGTNIPLITAGIFALLVLRTGISSHHFIIALTLAILCKKYLSKRSYYSIVAILTVTTFVSMYGSLAYGLPDTAPLSASNNSLTRFFQGIAFSDWFITLGSLANAAALFWLTAQVLSPLLARWRQPLHQIVDSISIRMTQGEPVRLRQEFRQDHFFQLAVGITLIVGIWMYKILASPNLLAGTDSGEWLMFSRFYLSKPMPNYIDPLTVPPILPALLAAFTSIIEPSVAIPLLTSLLFVGLGLSTFSLARELFNDSSTALIAMLLVTLGQTFFLDLTAFGGYLQLTAIIWMNVALFFWRRIGNGSQRIRDWCGLGLSTLLVLFSHTPTAIVLLPSTVLTFLWFWWKNKGAQVEVLLGVLACVTIPFEIWGVYLLALWDEQSGYAANAGGFYRRGIESAISYLGNNTSLLLLAAVASVVILLYLASNNKSRRLKTAAALVAVWFFTPVLVMLTTNILRIGTDYVRFVYYLAEPPLLALAFVGRLMFVRCVASIREASHACFSYISLPRVLLRSASLFGMTVVAIFSVGASVHSYPNTVRSFSITDSGNLLQVTNWLDSKLQDDSTILSPSSTAPWIEGLTGRASLADTETYLLYRPGEVDRALAADLIKYGTYAMDNGYAYIRMQQVPNTVPLNPSIAIYHRGIYVDSFTMQDRLIIIDTTTGTAHRNLNLDRDFYRLSGIGIVNDGSEAQMTMRYYSRIPNPTVVVFKTVTLSRDSPNVSIDLRLIAAGNTRINSVEFQVADPVETSGERAIGRTSLAWVNSEFGRIALYRKDSDNSYTVGNLDFTPFPSRLMTTQGTVDTGEPYIDATYLMEGQTNLDIQLNVSWQPDGRFRDGLRIYDIFDLMKRYDVGYLLTHRTDSSIRAVYQQYGYPQVYSNADYVVYKVPQN